MLEFTAGTGETSLKSLMDIFFSKLDFFEAVPTARPFCKPGR